MQREELERRVRAFPHWLYELELDGVRTPIFKPSFRNRQRQRKAHFFDPVVALCGGTLAGKRVLDLACNAGFWSLCAAEAGCDLVLGVDARPMHVEQANLVFEAKGIAPARYRFDVGDVMDLDLADSDPFDLVLCLGLLYHLADPLRLIELVSRWNSDLLVIDSSLSALPGRWFALYRDRPEERPFDAATSELVLIPTRGAIVELARRSGYAVATLKPRFSSYEGCQDYRVGARRAFVCAKRTPLQGLPAEVERSRLTRPLHVVGTAAWRTALALRNARA